MDYKELIEQLRDESNCDVLDYIEDAADAIETLLKEREMMIDFLKCGGKRCLSCIYDNRSIFDFPCNHCKETGGMSDYWEWCGIKDD